LRRKGVSGTKEIKVSYKGSTIIVRKTDEGLLACPVCGEYLFYSEGDLFSHIASHAKGTLKRIRPAPKSK
jgi:uncharacterized C2H2 Zn-finger protein